MKNTPKEKDAIQALEIACSETQKVRRNITIAYLFTMVVLFFYSVYMLVLHLM